MLAKAKDVEANLVRQLDFLEEVAKPLRSASRRTVGDLAKAVDTNIHHQVPLCYDSALTRGDRLDGEYHLVVPRVS